MPDITVQVDDDHCPVNGEALPCSCGAFLACGCETGYCEC